MNKNYTTFLENHKNVFKFYENKNNIKEQNINIKNWLYIFNVSCYDQDITIIFDEKTYKIGKTEQTMKNRIQTYDIINQIKDIECIHCSLPDQRESLLKKYLRYKANFKPVAGTEYFVGCKDFIKILMIIIVHFIEDDDIMKYYNSSFVELKIFYNIIKELLDKISNDSNFVLELKDELLNPKVYNEININYICEFCNSCFTTSYNLKNHQKTAKFCLSKQNKPVEETYKCEFCNKGFNLKTVYNNHIAICKDKIAIKDEKLLTRINELEKELNEKDIIIVKLKTKLSSKDKIIKKLEKTNKELIHYSYTTNNNDKNQ